MAAEARAVAFERRLISRSPEETERVAAALGKRLPPGTVVALSGELGAGKTCFVRGLARGLGVSDAVTSPTYALMHTYSGRRELHHYDAWLAGRARAFLDGGGVEGLLGPALAAVEWAERVADALPLPRIEVELAHAGVAERRVCLRVLADPAGQRADLCRELAAVVAEACTPAVEPPVEPPIGPAGEPPGGSRVDPSGGSPAASRAEGRS